MANGNGIRWGITTAIMLPLIFGGYLYTYSASQSTNQTISETAQAVEKRVSERLDRQEKRTKDTLDALERRILDAINRLEDGRRSR